MPSEKRLSKERRSQNKDLFTVIAPLKDLPGREMFAAGRVKTFLGDLIAEGRAEAVFDYRRAPLSVQGTLSNISAELPRIFAIELEYEEDVRSVLERLREDSSVIEPYVAPPRLLYATKSTAARSARSVGPADWWLDEVGLREARTLPVLATRAA